MSLININYILYVWTINYDILSTSCIDNISICNIEKYTFSICGKDKFFISGTEKIDFVYIA